MRGADAGDANFEGAQLQNVDFRGADLSGAVQVGATLAAAELGGMLDGAKLAGGAWQPSANLSGAIWIDGSVCARGSMGTCDN